MSGPLSQATLDAMARDLGYDDADQWMRHKHAQRIAMLDQMMAEVRDDPNLLHVRAVDEQARLNPFELDLLDKLRAADTRSAHIAHLISEHLHHGLAPMAAYLRCPGRSKQVSFRLSDDLTNHLGAVVEDASKLVRGLILTAAKHAGLITDHDLLDQLVELARNTTQSLRRIQHSARLLYDAGCSPPPDAHTTEPANPHVRGHAPPSPPDPEPPHEPAETASDLHEWDE